MVKREIERLSSLKAKYYTHELSPEEQEELGKLQEKESTMTRQQNMDKTLKSRNPQYVPPEQQDEVEVEDQTEEQDEELETLQTPHTEGGEDGEGAEQVDGAIGGARPKEVKFQDQNTQKKKQRRRGTQFSQREDSTEVSFLDIKQLAAIVREGLGTFILMADQRYKHVLQLWAESPNRLRDLEHLQQECDQARVAIDGANSEIIPALLDDSLDETSKALENMLRMPKITLMRLRLRFTNAY